MKRIYLCCIIYLIFLNVSAQTIEKRITSPAGYMRANYTENSFATYLRQLPLFPEGSKVKLYNGQEKRNQSAAYAIIDMEIGNRDLQQCADAVIRLRAEYLWAQKKYDEIKFNFTNGFPAEYKKWAEGNRIKVSGNNVQWYVAGGKDYSYKTFRKYLDIVFMYAGTASLSKELQTVSYKSLQPGDVFIKGGSPGHAVIVVDVATHPKTKKKVFLLAQSYMPAQQIHILVNPISRNFAPWYELVETDEGKLYTQEWTFDKRDLKRFK
ncbi:DUF4846 domain-containing protein [Bacteroides sp.]|uniref:DUF4846 domain-containing protein n=1 Tax=Bacteroides sp. TaxID=29523 RepID=UPI00261A761E|nr:DUF4846 domain-containing protein [Bacteroides sp.]MDD3037685.1 DUF4846 domain-containing protein [Bacteroides sp.]